MSILSDFEDRVGGAFEGLFAGAFRSPVQPVEIAKALGRAMDDGRVLGVGKVYAPLVYEVAISEADEDRLLDFLPTLGGELETYLTNYAREHAYTLAGKPVISWVVHDDLKLGRFRVSATLSAAEDLEDLAEPPAGAVAGLYDQDSEPEAAFPALDTVTVGELAHDVALRGDRMVIGRLNSCDICLSDVNASREHAAFVHDPEGWALEDLGSTNGTLLNGAPVQRSVLRDGDVIEIGLTRLVYHHQRG
jgi:hypothetical protein